MKGPKKDNVFNTIYLIPNKDSFPLPEAGEEEYHKAILWNYDKYFYKKGRPAAKSLPICCCRIQSKFQAHVMEHQDSS